MSIRITGGRRSLLTACTLLLASSALTALLVWPQSEVKSGGPDVAFSAPAKFVEHATANTAPRDDLEPTHDPAPTLQELASDEDPAMRREALALLDLLNEEAVADYR